MVARSCLLNLPLAALYLESYSLKTLDIFVYYIYIYICLCISINHMSYVHLGGIDK